jgi:hypothetical protein
MDYPFLVNGGKPCGDEKDTQSVLFHGCETQSSACRAASQYAGGAPHHARAEAQGERE